jgi:hypothetical protein
LLIAAYEIPQGKCDQHSLLVTLTDPFFTLCQLVLTPKMMYFSNYWQGSWTA